MQKEQIQVDKKSTYLHIFFIFNQIFLSLLIITYAILSQSIYSATSIIFLIISLTLTIARPYYLDYAPHPSIQPQQRKVISYSVEKIVWLTFTALNIGFIITKSVLYFTDYSNDMSDALKQFLQIKTVDLVFLPIILIPFSIMAALQPKKQKVLKDFKQKIKPITPLPLYLILYLLIIFIQIFSVSITGLIYLAIAIYLYWMKSFNFKDIYFRILLIVIQVMTTFTIFATYLTTCEYLDAQSALEQYQFYGIDSLNQFLVSYYDRGHFICQILLSLMCAYLNRLFIYQKFNTIYMNFYSPKIDDISKFKEEMKRQEDQIKRMNKKINEDIFQQGQTVRKFKRSSLKQVLISRNSQKVKTHKQQVEMKVISQRGSFHSDNYEHHQAQEAQVIKDQMFLQQVLNFEEEIVDQTEQQARRRLNSQKNRKGINLKKIRKKILTWITTFLHFISSPEFSLRVIEIISIIVIQRYNNVYSFVNLIWLAYVSSVQNLLYIRIFTAFIILPLQICNFVITYFYNIPYSPAQSITNGGDYGFQKIQSVWIDIIIFNLYLNYLILFVKSYKQILAIHSEKSKKIRRKPTSKEIALAFIFRYTYLFTLAALFFLGFSQPTVINIIYVILFLIFFSNGDKMVFVEKQRNRKKWFAITTFSKHYWFIIVYYTLLCIIAKYMYFLFFNEQLSAWLDPTGINEIYKWAFNFSLSSICASNTTPFFIIFVLAQMQIMIYRSHIYTNYSFSIMADIVQGTSFNSQSKKSKFKRAFIKAVVFANQIYYQSIYYISGLIIIGCSYRWSFIGLAIIILTSFGIIKAFTKKLLGIILILNLAFLFLNYLVLLINEYPVIVQTIGQSFLDKINTIAIFIGFSLAKQSYASLFVLNVIIFYFCVICYSLSNILAVKQFDQLSDNDPSRIHTDNDHHSFKEPTIVDSEFQDDRFAKNYRRDVIESTKKFYSQNLVQKYSGIRKIGNFLRMFLTDLVAIFVIIQCLYFRLSVSMFLFLIVYLVFYFSLFDNIGSIYTSSRFSEKVQAELDRFASKQKLLENQVMFQSLIEDRNEITQVQKFINFKAQNILILKSDSRKNIWKYSAFLTVTCLILTYASQFMNSDFYNEHIQFSQSENLEIILFVIGINSNSNFTSCIYFYYVMLIINILQKLTIFLSERLMAQQNQDQTTHRDYSRQLPKLQNPEYLINTYVTQNFIIQCRGNPMHLNEANNIGEVVVRNEGERFEKQANLLVYFEYKMAVIHMNVLFGCIHFMIRFYLWLMLINIYSKTNVFGFAYLIAVLIFWFRQINFVLIRDINKAAIIILILQYFFLLLDINTTTSPIPLPTNQKLSLLEYLIHNEAWVQFLAVSNQQANNNSYLASFLINSIVIFFTQLCFTVYQKVAQKIVSLILQIYHRYESIIQKLNINKQEQIEINLASYKSWWHRFAVFLYENLIMNSYLIVSLLIFVLLSGIHNYLAIFLLLIAFLYIYLGIFTTLSEKEGIFKYTRVFFRVFNILQFIILLINIILNMPIIPTSGNIASVLNQFKALTSIQQVILILFIQVWIDLNSSHSFQSISQNYRIQNKKRREIALRCLTFQKNDFLISSLIREFKQVLSFDSNIAEAMKIIKQWHASTKRDMKVIDYDFETIKQKQSTKKIRQQIQQQQLDNDHKQFSTILRQFARSHTDIVLSYNYYDTLRFIIEHVKGITTYNSLNLSAWRFIKQDYDVVVQILDQYQSQYQFICQQIIDNQSDTIAEVLTQIKKSLPKNQDSHSIIKQKFTDKLILKPQKFHQKQKNKFQFIPFILSNIEVLIVFLIEIYYMVNPCLLSFPLIAYAFCYFIIANKKFTNLLLIYIFILIFAGQIIQIQNLADKPQTMAILKFFFYVDETTNTIHFSLAYLYFLFVVIFFNQEIIRYKGNKFIDFQEIQNLQKAFLRILLNQNQKSRLYLWKYCEIQQQILENINPFNIAAFQVQNNLEQLFSREARFTSVFSDRKIGIDFYPPIAAVQIFITIYLIFFYPLMTDIKGYSLQQSTKYYQFSSDMVIGVLVHVVNIVIERYITIQVISRKTKVIIKYIYTLFIFLLFCWFIYYLAPYQTANNILSTFYQPSPALIAFAFFYFIYFYLSALQVKYGYKEFKSFNSLMTRRGYVNYYMVLAYTSIPFLYEIKIIMDWTFSHTSLTLYDWFRQFSIYLRAFSSKINYITATTTTVLGHTIPWFYKIIGWVGFILILLIIFGPMILFSGLNPVAQANLVTSGSMQIALQIKNGNSFTLYETSHFSNPPLIFNQELYDSQGFSNISVLQQMTSSDIPEQFQSVTYEPYSDFNWAISQPNYYNILSSINASVNALQSNNTPPYYFQLVATYQLNREVSTTVASDTSFTYPSPSTYLNVSELIQLNKTMTTCNSPSNFNNFYISLIRLNTINNIYKPRPIYYYNTSSSGQAQQPYLFNVTLNLFCQNGTANISDTNNVYWGLYLQNQTQGLQFYVYCDKYQNIIGGYGFTALYTSIILVVAGFIRTLFDGNLPYVMYEMNPKPDNILQICEAINTLRVRKQFRQEYLMYFELIDIVRSPQIMKHLSGSYPYLIQEAHEKQLHQIQLKQAKKQKLL